MDILSLNKDNGGYILHRIKDKGMLLSFPSRIQDNSMLFSSPLGFRIMACFSPLSFGSS